MKVREAFSSQRLYSDIKGNGSTAVPVQFDSEFNLGVLHPLAPKVSSDRTIVN